MALILSWVHGQPLRSAHVLFLINLEGSRPVFIAKKAKIRKKDLISPSHNYFFILFFPQSQGYFHANIDKKGSRIQGFESSTVELTCKL